MWLNSLVAKIEDLDVSPLPQTTANQSTLEEFLGVAIAIIAAISLLVIVIGGVRYIMSRGDPQATARAKNTIIYAVVGLVVAMTAQAIVSFVLKGATS